MLRLLPMFCAWLSTAFVYFGLNLNAGNLSGSLHTNFILNAAIGVPARPERVRLLGGLFDHHRHARALLVCPRWQRGPPSSRPPSSSIAHALADA